VWFRAVTDGGCGEGSVGGRDNGPIMPKRNAADKGFVLLIPLNARICQKACARMAQNIPICMHKPTRAR